MLTQADADANVLVLHDPQVKGRSLVLGQRFGWLSVSDSGDWTVTGQVTGKARLIDRPAGQIQVTQCARQ